MMHSLEQQIHDRLGSALYRLAAIEHRAAEAAETPRNVGRLLTEVRKLTAELQRSFEELQDLMGRAASAQRAAALAAERADLLLQLSPAACLVLDSGGAVVTANPAAARLLNVSHRHLVGKSFPLFLSADRDEFVRRLRDLRPGDAPIESTITLRPRERSAVECSLVAASDAAGRVMVMLSPTGVAVPSATAPDEA